MKLTGYRKNIIVLIIITVLVGTLTEYFELAAFLFPVLLVAITIWLMITPFKMYNDEN
jgi:hypothetical protein